ncbi:MAG: hypothetical protein MUF31_12485, partial [Akkermansiaceae bacterium]|nr:hypothetical protein [Akkermansiaceae bacterium]
MKKLSLVIVIALSFPAVWWAMKRDRDPGGRPSAPAERVEPSLKITARSERHNIGANSRNDDAPPGWPDDVPFLDRRTQVPLDWDLATLEKYLDYCKTQLPGNHLASLMTRIFPYPEGGGNHPGVMLEGSISLSDQMALCDHYLDPLGRQLAHSNIYRKYQEAGRLDLYRSELLEKLPQDSYRRDRFWDFYLEQFRETGPLLRFLESEEPAQLMREGNYYDY